MWDKIAKMALKAGEIYIEKRGIDGVMEDVGKVASWASNRFPNISSSDTNGDGIIDADEIQEWTNSFVPEMRACLKEAKRQDILSKEFEQNIQYTLITGYDAILELFNEDLEDIGDFVNEIDSICDEALETIFKKCNGSSTNAVIKPKSDCSFAMDVKGVYPANGLYNMTILVGVIHSKQVVTDQIILLPTGEHASIKSIIMFGKILSHAECGDTCALVLDGNFFDDLSDTTPFKIEELNNTKAIEESQEIAVQEQEYLKEYQLCLEEGDELSPKELRMLDRMRVRLGISEERASELIKSLNPSFTEEEQEFVDEIKACLEDDGILTDRELKMLHRMRSRLGISEERGQEILKIITKS